MSPVTINNWIPYRATQCFRWPLSPLSGCLIPGRREWGRDTWQWMEADKRGKIWLLPLFTVLYHLPQPGVTNTPGHPRGRGQGEEFTQPRGECAGRGHTSEGDNKQEKEICSGTEIKITVRCSQYSTALVEGTLSISTSIPPELLSGSKHN